jgi:hypothetical protein
MVESPATDASKRALSRTLRSGAAYGRLLASVSHSDQLTLVNGVSSLAVGYMTVLGLRVPGEVLNLSGLVALSLLEIRGDS